MTDENDGHAQFSAHFLHEFEDLRLDGDVQRGGGFVGDEQVGLGDQGHGDHDALAHAAGKLVGIHANAVRGVGDSDFVEQIQGAFAGAGTGDFLVDQKRLDQLVSNAQIRVQGGHGVLEDHGDAASADLVELPSRNVEQVNTVKNSLPGLNAPRRLGQQAHQGITGDGFAGAGLTDDAQGPARLDLKGNVPHRASDARPGVKADAQIVDREQGHVQSLEARTSRASRNPSPRKLRENRVSAITKAG